MLEEVEGNYEIKSTKGFSEAVRPHIFVITPREVMPEKMRQKQFGNLMFVVSLQDILLRVFE